ncbi:MAG TPA: reverse transcriptase-like protein [Candidatus Bathyarchaeia archaeon]|nr:reverse transcriptase-like protein [Candidatus Bathyarchaeia archaeon]
MSNNVAEYAALCEALRFLLKEQMTASPIEVRSDSRLVVNQMKGNWKFHKGLYAEKYREAKEPVAQFAEITFQWIPREEERRSRLAQPSAIASQEVRANAPSADAIVLIEDQGQSSSSKKIFRDLKKQRSH